MTAAELMPAAASAMLRVEQGLALLREARSLDEVRQVNAQAEALRVLMRELGAARSAVLVATELVTRAERRQGEMTAAMEKAPPTVSGGMRGLPESGRPDTKTEALADHGLTPQRAHECEQLARIPEAEFETHVEEIKAAGKEPTRGRVLERAKTRQSDAPPATKNTTDPRSLVSMVRDFIELLDEHELMMFEREASALMKRILKARGA